MSKYGKEYQLYLERLVKTARNGRCLANTYGSWLKSTEGKHCVKLRKNKDKKRDERWQITLSKLDKLDIKHMLGENEN
ncbi:hypothetical protein KKC91_11100 [bacterium]|nr:hypothetical protein [bacterium]